MVVEASFNFFLKFSSSLSRRVLSSENISIKASCSLLDSSNFLSASRNFASRVLFLSLSNCNSSAIVSSSFFSLSFNSQFSSSNFFACASESPWSSPSPLHAPSAACELKQTVTNQPNASHCHIDDFLFKYMFH
eukprot:TRINITY_DN8299_c0_g1_i4.p1 TRINITY_DN8299_c0_g1~~TRINITY_DN8299_c0_g1_i4.p1  ORF type:complete len:134 (-),score=22.37 TRINITY_DN8299_c0_g1_i4:244-645(-)